MFQFPGFPPRDYGFITRRRRSAPPGFPIQKSPDLWVFAPPRSLSQLVTSFIGSQCQGIHPVLFVTGPYVSFLSPAPAFHKPLTAYIALYAGPGHCCSLVPHGFHHTVRYLSIRIFILTPFQAPVCLTALTVKHLGCLSIRISCLPFFDLPTVHTRYPD